MNVFITSNPGRWLCTCRYEGNLQGPTEHKGITINTLHTNKYIYSVSFNFPEVMFRSLCAGNNNFSDSWRRERSRNVPACRAWEPHSWSGATVRQITTELSVGKTTLLVTDKSMDSLFFHCHLKSFVFNCSVDVFQDQMQYLTLSLGVTLNHTIELIG